MFLQISKIKENYIASATYWNNNKHSIKMGLNSKHRTNEKYRKCRKRNKISFPVK